MDIKNQSALLVKNPKYFFYICTSYPHQKLDVDFLGKYPRLTGGICCIFIVVDHFSRFYFLKTMKAVTEEEDRTYLIQLCTITRKRL